MKKQSGFTLIELVIVIVIIGILAATALPRFINVTSNARVAAVSGLAGGLRSAAALARAYQVANNESAGQSVTMDGVSVPMQAYYPTTAGIELALTDYTGFTPTIAGSSVTFTLGTLTNCSVTYTNSGTTTGGVTTVGESVSTTTSGC